MPTTKDMIITNKFIYGGMFVDKYFFRLDDNSVVQVSEAVYNQHNIGDNYEGQ